MSLESIKQEIQKSVDIERSRLQDDWEKKRVESSEKLEREYLEIKDRTIKLIDKEEKERYIEELLAFKMEEKKKLMEQRKIVHTAILEKVILSLEELLGKEKYYAFIREKVEKFSESGDTIYLSTNDEKSYGPQLLKDMKHPLNLLVRADLKGGVIVEKPSFNYNFSSEALLEEKRVEVESFLGKKLYEEI